MNCWKKLYVLLSFPNHVAISPGVFANTDNSFDDGNNNIYSLEKDKELGDIVISIPYVNQQCYKNNWKLKHRLPVLITHGVCHLIGYDHETNKDYALMQEKEKNILEAIDDLDKILGGA